MAVFIVCSSRLSPTMPNPIAAISYSPIGDISFELDLEAQEKEPSFSSSAGGETGGSASLEKKSDELRASVALPLRTIEMKRQDVPIFFINLDESTDRRQSFVKDFAALPENLSSGLQLQRITAVTTTEVQSMLENGSLVLNGVKELTFSKRKFGDIGQYTFNEAACTLSHLKAICQAYNDGHDMVMIFEDDAALTTEFMENWRAFANQAPKDWQILQWTTSNAAANRRQLYRSNDLWVAWKPYLWASMAYTIRREGMKRILDSTFKRFK